MKAVTGIKNSLLFFFSIIILFILVLTLVCAIPNTDSFLKNYESSLSTLDNEGEGAILTFSYTTGSKLDSWTDRGMLWISSMDISEELNPLQKAISMQGYTRYWQGYVLFLRPLLYFTEYSKIRYLAMITLGILLFLVISYTEKRLSTSYALIFLISTMLIQGIVIPFCMQYYAVSYITLIASLYILKKYNNLKSQWWIINVFMVIGMLTNFFDFLTAPLITFGIPMIFLISLIIKENSNYKSNTFILIKGGISWIVGYAGAWITKWILGSLILHKDVIADGMNQVSYRMSGLESEGTYPLGYTIVLQFYTLFQPIIAAIPKKLLILLFVFLLSWIIYCIYKIFKNGRTFKQFIPFILLCIAPFVWYAVLTQHSYIHAYFTYRSTVISFMSFFVALNINSWCRKKSIP